MMQPSYFGAGHSTKIKIIPFQFVVAKSYSQHYEKFVLLLGKFDFSQNGIIHKNILGDIRMIIARMREL